MPAGHYTRTKFVPLKDRLLKKTVVTDSCWIWTGGKAHFGYGSIQCDRSTNSKKFNISAHRASWMVFKGPIPDGLCVLHSCDNPACVNPDHLFLGTKMSNTLDMRAKGRMKVGRQLPQSKLTEEAVMDIRRGAESINALARKYKVSWVTVYNAKTRKNWSHIP